MRAPTEAEVARAMRAAIRAHRKAGVPIGAIEARVGGVVVRVEPTTESERNRSRHEQETAALEKRLRAIHARRG